MSIRTALVLVLGFVLLAGGALFFWPDLDNEPPRQRAGSSGERLHQLGQGG